MIKAIDPTKQLPTIGDAVLAKHRDGTVMVSRFGHPSLPGDANWWPQGDIGENAYRTSDILWWAPLPDVDEVV